MLPGDRSRTDAWPTGLGVPAYFGPWETQHWARLRAAGPAVVVINPDNGPGCHRHPGYRPLVRRLRQRGATVLAYVATGWLGSADWMRQADAARRWYGVDGIFWDQIPIDGVTGRDLAPFVAWSAAAGLRAEAFNPGRRIPSNWRRLAPMAWWVTFEGTGRTYLDAVREPAHHRDWHLVHSVTSRDREKVRERVRDVGPGLAFVTVDRMPNPWDVYLHDHDGWDPRSGAGPGQP